MAYIIREEQPIDIVIYAILSPFDKQCYIWKTPQKTLKKAYQNHYHGSSSKTKSMFQKAKSLDKSPPIYTLETLTSTHEEAFLHCIAWAKYFEDKEFSCLTGKVLAQYTEDLQDEAKRIYDEIKDIPLEEICNSDTELYPNYGRKKAISKSKASYTISFQLNPTEYEKVQQSAKQHKISVSKYCRDMITNGQVKILDASSVQSVREYTNQLSEQNKLLKQIMLTIYRTGKYYLPDLEIIEAAVKQNKETRHLVTKEFNLIMDKFLEYEKAGNED